MNNQELEQRFKGICHKLFGPDKGEELYNWIQSSRPPYFRDITARVMIPIWEMNKVDLRTKILCCISLFTGLHLPEVKFFFQMAVYHGIPQEEIEEILLLTGLEAGFPTAEMAIGLLKEVYDEHSAASAAD
jgi:alkylhydroperoxidase/carboxymuconolactone decarboxylase family protein YurZ